MKKSLPIIGIIIWIIVVVAVIIVAFIGFNSNFSLSGIMGINMGSNLLKEETLSMNDIDSIVLQNDRKTIEIVSTDSERGRVLQYGRQNTSSADLFSVDINNGDATIDSKTEWKLFSIITWNEKLVLEIPASWDGNVDISSSSGGIRFKDSFVWKNVKINGTSGGINIARGLTADNLDVIVSSGGIKADGEIVVSGKISVNTTSGGINISRPVRASDVRINGASGSIRLDDVNAANIDLTNASGGIRLGNIETNKYTITNSSGGINIAGITGAGSIFNSSGGITARLTDPVGEVAVETRSGSIKISVDKALAFIFTGEKSSGSIRASFPLQESNGGNNVSAEVGNNPTAKITAKATSGGIRISQE